MDDSERRRPARGTSGRPFLNTAQAAHYLGLSARHLERMRTCGGGPRFRRHGRFVFYHQDDLEAWSGAHASGNSGHD